MILVKEHLKNPRQKRRQQQQQDQQVEGTDAGVGLAVSGQAREVVTSIDNRVTPGQVSASSSGKRVNVDKTGNNRVSAVQLPSPIISLEPGDAAATSVGVLAGGSGGPTRTGNADARGDSEGFSTRRSVTSEESVCSAKDGDHAVSSSQISVGSADNSLSNNDSSLDSPGFSISTVEVAVAAGAANPHPVFPRRFVHPSGANSRSSGSQDSREVRSESKESIGIKVGASSAGAAAADGDSDIKLASEDKAMFGKAESITPTTTCLSLIPSGGTSASGMQAFSLPRESESFNGEPAGVSLGTLGQGHNTIPSRSNGLGNEVKAITGWRESRGHSEEDYHVSRSGTHEGIGAISSTTNSGDSYTYSSDFAAFTPISEERLEIVKDELKQLSDRAKRALEEVGERVSIVQGIRHCGMDVIQVL